MKQYMTPRDEEAQLIEAINRVSSQVHRSDRQRESSAHSEFLVEVIEHLEEQLDSIRRNREASSTA